MQCGFCIPGMVMCAKGLIDVNPNPSRVEAAFAIRNNYCRCTGYKKIIDGIILAAEMLREDLSPEEQETRIKVGSRSTVWMQGIRCWGPENMQMTWISWIFRG